MKTETGSTTLRNARFIRHQTKKKVISWAADGTKPDGAAELETKPDDAARGTDSSPGSAGSSGTDIVTEQRRVSERLAARENRF